MDNENVQFRLYSTKEPGSSGGLKDWKKVVNWKVSEKIVYDEGSHTASLKEGTRFDPNLKTIVVAHGNGGGKLDIQVWSIYGTLSSIIFLKFTKKHGSTFSLKMFALKFKCT